MIKAIVFDVGGVILRTEDYSTRQNLEKQHHLPHGSVEKLVFNSIAAKASTLGLLKEAFIWEQVAKELSLSKEKLLDFINNFWAGDRVDQQIIRYLKRCQNKFTTALLTNAWKDARQVLSEKYQIIEGKSVDYLLISSELGLAKPDPRIYSHLSTALNCQFSEILFVDDFNENIEAAEALGIQTIHFNPAMDVINEIQLKLDNIR